MQLLDGRKTARVILNEIAIEVTKKTQSGHRKPNLTAILIGNSAPSLTYVNAKMKACKQVGFNSKILHLNESISQKKLLQVIKHLNSNNDIDGFIVQLPLPKHINQYNIIEAISPNKDVDGFHPSNIGKMFIGLKSFIPATPFGIIELLKRNNVKTLGKHVVVLGRSNIVGKPISILLSDKSITGNATVTLCHSKSNNLKNIVKQADILIAAIGVPNFVTADMVKDGVIVIDVGITRVKDTSKKKGYKLVGDVNFEQVMHKASKITPVPGGVGPMTIAMLLKNTWEAYCNRQ